MFILKNSATDINSGASVVVQIISITLIAELDGDKWPSPHCRYPEFFVRRKHWRDMSGRFEFVVDDALQTFRVKDKYSRESVSFRERNIERTEMKMVVRCIDNVDESRREVKEYLTHVTDNKW